MNAISLLWSLGVFLVFAGATAFIWWGAGKHSHWSNRKRRVVCRALLVGALAFALFTYVTDSRQRAVTLFETRFSWKDGKPQAWEFEVEHPGTVHQLLLAPLPAPFQEADFPVVLQLSVDSGSSESILAESVEFALTTEITTKNAPVRRTWESHRLEFRPVAAGVHSLVIGAKERHPPILFVRIEDPLKKDGERAPGY